MDNNINTVLVCCYVCKRDVEVHQHGHIGPVSEKIICNSCIEKERRTFERIDKANGKKKKEMNKKMEIKNPRAGTGA